MSNQTREAEGLGAANRPPNIVIILADDLGYGDIAAYSPASRLPTPHLDRLAAQGMLFTDAHSGSAVCTPTRYGVLTGRYAWRTRLKSGVLGGFSTHLIDPARLTVAGLLKQRGYHTAGIGKWHLGLDYAARPGAQAASAVATPGDKYRMRPEEVDYGGRIDHGPLAYGFDYFFGIPASLDMQPYIYVENDRVVEAASATIQGSRFPAYYRPGPSAPSFKHIEVFDTLTQRAVDYIHRRAKAKEQPFFLYYALPAPHKPVLPAKRYQGRSGIGPYGDFVIQTDDEVGRVLAALDEAGVAEHTLVIVTSDNGNFMYLLEEDAAGPDHAQEPAKQAFRPSTHRPNGPLRGTKADIFEAGHRVPFLVRWPGHIKPGSRSDATVCLTDLMATSAEAASASLPVHAAEDSFSLVPLFRGRPAGWTRAPVVHHSINGSFALRDGRWKLILTSGSGGRAQPKGRPGDGVQLYDMAKDLGETEDLAKTRADVVQRLGAKLAAIQRDGRSR